MHAAAAGAYWEILDEAARAVGSRPFAIADPLDRARRDLGIFLLQYRLEPAPARQAPRYRGPRGTFVRDRLDRWYFERLYSEWRDPWGFETSEYERKKYQRTLSVLEGRRCRRALEGGASIGVFTAMLAPLRDELLAVDVSDRAVAIARERLARFPNVWVERPTLPGETPEGPFDLIVVSEVSYYLPREQMLAARGWLERDLAPRGVLLAALWRKETRTYPLQGDEVQRAFGGAHAPEQDGDARRTRITLGPVRGSP